MKIHTIIISFFLMLGAAFSACKKEKKPEPVSTVPSGCDTTFNASYNPDTIQPSPYLTYPGSVWNYDDGTVESCSAWEQVGIEETCVSVHKTYTIVPKTTFGYIYGEHYLYLKPNHKALSTSRFWRRSLVFFTFITVLKTMLHILSSKTRSQ